MTAAVWVLCAILLGITFLLYQGIKRLDIIVATNAELATEVADLNTSLDVISTGIGNLNSTLAVAAQRILDLEAAGIAPEIAGSLRTAVDRAQEIAAALIPAVDPGQTTPPAESLPVPPEDAPPVVEVPSPATPDASPEPAVALEDVAPIAIDTGAAPVPTGSTESSTYGADGSQ